MTFDQQVATPAAGGPAHGPRARPWLRSCQRRGAVSTRGCPSAVPWALSVCNVAAVGNRRGRANQRVPHHPPPAIDGSTPILRASSQRGCLVNKSGNREPTAGRGCWRRAKGLKPVTVSRHTTQNPVFRRETEGCIHVCPTDQSEAAGLCGLTLRDTAPHHDGHSGFGARGNRGAARARSHTRGHRLRLADGILSSK